MPAELPGLYWDENRNRYFPLSSKPKPPPVPASTISSNLRKDREPAKVEGTFGSQFKGSKKRKRQNDPWRSSIRMLSSNNYTETMGNAHEIVCAQYASTSRVTLERLPTLGPIQSFCSTHVGDATWHLCGDSQGWIYTRQVPDVESLNTCRWVADPILRSSDPVSAISTSGTHCVVSCLGPGKVSVQNMIDPELLFLLRFNTIYDIRTSHLQGSSLVLGGNRKAAYISDIDVSRKPEHLVTNSDVFSITRLNSLVYTGSRSGSIHCFDIRTRNHSNQTLFDNRFGTSPRSSVVHLDIIRGYEILMSHSNGDLLTYDLRFASKSTPASPIKIFEGHVNTHTHNLGIAVDHERDLLYAAGQDNRIRAWSLRTGSSLTPQPSGRPTSKQGNPLTTTFSDSVHSLHIAEEYGKEGVSLWVTSGRELYEFYLGQRDTGSIG